MNIFTKNGRVVMYKGQIAVSSACCTCTPDTYGGTGGGGGVNWSQCPAGTVPGVAMIPGIGCVTLDWLCANGDVGAAYPGGTSQQDCLNDNASTMLSLYRDGTIPFGSLPCDKCQITIPEPGYTASCCIDEDMVATGYDSIIGGRPVASSCGPSWRTQMICCQYYTATGGSANSGCRCVDVNMCDLECYAAGTCYAAMGTDGAGSLGGDIPASLNISECAGWYWTTISTGTDPCPCDDPDQTVQCPPRCFACDSPDCEDGCGGNTLPAYPVINGITCGAQKWACYSHTTCGCGAP